jgi:hypothetical protein
LGGVSVEPERTDRLNTAELNVMYDLESLLTGLRYPSKIISEVNRLYSQRRYGVRYNPRGMDVFEEDWDNLIVLDACRYDEFECRADLPGKLESRTSRASTTHQFIRGNFAGRTLEEVVYVSANGWFASLEDEIDAEVHEFIHVERDAVDGLTSRPETVTETALDAAEEYPNKRLIVHYMQPHQPYLGPTGQRMNHDGALYQTIENNDVSREDVVHAYRENLDLVIEEVERLVHELQGKNVVTADHGELLGERTEPIPISYYGHPDGVYVDELVTVPWLVYHNGERKEIVAEEAASRDDYDSEAVDEQLRSLGYKL